MVDGLERALVGRAQVLRLDAWRGAGRQAAGRYNVRGVPTFIVFDGDGQPVYHQVGLPNKEEIMERIETLPYNEKESGIADGRDE
jgi:thioredoxin-like negative regulator of GroEL